MRIDIRYLGGSRATAGRDHEPAELPEGATVADVAAWIVHRHPALGSRLDAVRWARNWEFVEPTAPLDDGDEIALLPPVAGGVPRAWLTAAPLDADAVARAVASPTCGATVLFVGTVRDHNEGAAVSGMHYEAYEPMAGRQLERIAMACSAAHPGADVAIAHRHGSLAVGDTSVVIAAAAPHRDAAFAACRDALERIKRDVPIWKREARADGETWVGWGGG
ncbi:MAG TPA: molybdenum cofactor biosynthesis protein MoaE [Myxococcota bacterium]|nr:molybdenum cofactor biosynthesis protein MoaE [Myxococcota bacterium]